MVVVMNLNITKPGGENLAEFKYINQSIVKVAYGIQILLKITAENFS